MTDSLDWAWWTPKHDEGQGARHLLPVGQPPGVRFRFDRDLWTMEPPFPDHHPIAVTVGSNPRFTRYVFLHLGTETISLQRDPGTSNVDPVNSSVAALVSSIGVYAAWRSRILAIEGTPQVASLAAAAIDHLNAIEDAVGTGQPPPDFWPNKIQDLAKLL